VNGWGAALSAIAVVDTVVARSRAVIAADLRFENISIDFFISFPQSDLPW
jgi:hypothetical protein